MIALSPSMILAVYAQADIVIAKFAGHEREHTVGFWGVKILARSDTELRSLASIEDLGGEFDHEGPLNNGWRVATIYRGSASRNELMAMVHEIQAPVLIAQIADSDFALVWFANPEQPISEFTLHPALAEGYQSPVDQSDQDAAPAALIDWAGIQVSETEVAKAVNGKMVFAEDSFMRLAGALGAFPLDQLDEHIFGPPPEDELTT